MGRRGIAITGAVTAVSALCSAGPAAGQAIQTHEVVVCTANQPCSRTPVESEVTSTAYSGTLTACRPIETRVEIYQPPPPRPPVRACWIYENYFGADVELLAVDGVADVHVTSSESSRAFSRAITINLLR